MKYETRTVTRRVPERLGDIDWDHPEIAKQPDKAEMLRAMESAFKDGKRVRATTNGGDCWMFCMQEVLSVGMWDGWPYWKPMPSVETQGPLGGEWHSFQSINHFWVVEPKEPA